jgi:hypothetical protein
MVYSKAKLNAIAESWPLHAAWAQPKHKVHVCHQFKGCIHRSPNTILFWLNDYIFAWHSQLQRLLSGQNEARQNVVPSYAHRILTRLVSSYTFFFLDGSSLQNEFKSTSVVLNRRLQQLFQTCLLPPSSGWWRLYLCRWYRTSDSVKEGEVFD